MPLYVIEDRALREISRTTFKGESLMERDDLQQYFKQNISLLGKVLAEDLFVLSDEFSGWEDSSRRIDLLCLTKEQDLVVVEIKRTEDGGHMELQAIRYAAMVSPMTADQATDAHKKMLERDGMDGTVAQSRIEEFVGEGVGESLQLTGKVNIVLVSADFSKEITSTVLWLNDQFGMNIRCVRLTPYKNRDQVLVDIEQIIPLPEAADYLIKLSNQEAQRRRERKQAEDERRELFKRFWLGFLQHCQRHGASSLFSPKRTIYKPYYEADCFEGKGGISLSCKVLQQSVEVYIYIHTSTDRDTNQRIFNNLKQKQEDIHTRLGFEVIWDAKDGRSAFKIVAQKAANGLGLDAEQAGWDDSYQWLLATSKKMAEVFSPAVDAAVR